MFYFITKQIFPPELKPTAKI